MSSNWFAKKLGVPQQGGQQSTPPAQQPPPAQYPQQQAPAPQRQGEVTGFYEVLNGAPNAKTEGGAAHKQGKVGTCPECGSGNYFQLRTGHHCYDCGYPVLQGEAIR